MVPAVEYPVYALVRELVGHMGAAVTEDTTCHMQLYIRTDILLFKCPSFEFVAVAFFAMFVAQVLHVTFTGLIAKWAIERMVELSKFHHPCTSILHPLAGDVFYDHAIHHIGAAGSHQFRHGPWIRS